MMSSAYDHSLKWGRCVVNMNPTKCLKNLKQNEKYDEQKEMKVVKYFWDSRITTSLFLLENSTTSHVRDFCEIENLF